MSTPPRLPARPPGLFFAGTDTGVGKTFVVCQVARHLRRQGHTVAVCKPVATGAELTEEGWLSEDTRLLADAAGMPGQWRRVTPWTFLAPAAPPVAARQAGVTLALDTIVAAVRERQHPEVPLLVEGVGGLLCPLTDTSTVADLVAQLGLPLVIVARRALGTLNHTLMTCEIAQHRGLAIAGVVVSETTPCAGVADETNVEELRRRGVPVLAVLPHGKCPGLEVVSGTGDVDWWTLCSSVPELDH